MIIDWPKGQDRMYPGLSNNQKKITKHQKYVVIQIHRISTDQIDPRVKFLNHQMWSQISRIAQIRNIEDNYLQNSIIEELIL